MNFDHLVWNEIGRVDLYSHRLFRLYESQRVNRAGSQANFLVVDAPNWVNVAAVTKNSQDEDCLLLVRQYRFGLNATTLEFPGGVVEAHESPLKAAQRELLEETGYRAKHWELLGSVNPNPSFMTNQVYAYLALDLSREQPPSPDQNEIIEAGPVPLAHLTKERQPDFFANGIMLLTWHWFLSRQAQAANLSKSPLR